MLGSFHMLSYLVLTVRLCGNYSGMPMWKLLWDSLWSFLSRGTLLDLISSALACGSGSTTSSSNGVGM